MSVLEYAVSVLAVPQLVICGHTGCGGVAAACACEPTALRPVDAHITPLRALYDAHRGELASIEPFTARIDRLVQLNVMAQAEALAALSVIREAASPPRLHGLIDTTVSGLLETVCEHADDVRTPVAVAA
ncbi:carbonic anhydr [Salinisphaera sp. T31B1]